MAENQTETEETLTKEEVRQFRQVMAEAAREGTAEAGKPAQAKTEAEIKREQAKAFWKGTEIEKAIERHG